MKNEKNEQQDDILDMLEGNYANGLIVQSAFYQMLSFPYKGIRAL